MSVEPLDPEVLAEGERLWDASGEAMIEQWDLWVWDHADALLAVARDHARLTAEVESLRTQRNNWVKTANTLGERLVSAEAGDTERPADWNEVDVHDGPGAVLSVEAGDTGTQVPNAGPWPPTHWPAPGLSAEAGDTDA